MTIEFTLIKEDLLQLQLFMASQSEQIISSRKNSKWMWPLVYVTLGLSLIVTTNKELGIALLIGAVLWFFFYPVYLRNRFVRIYNKHIEDHYFNRLNQPPVILTFTDEYIEEIDYQGESKLKIKEIVRIDEVRDYCFLKYSSGVSLVIPVSRLSDKESFVEYLKNLAAKHGIDYKVDMEWKWK